MSNHDNHHKINYIEFTSTNIQATKQFYSAAFGWTFKDWGPEYISFVAAGIDGGFRLGAIKDELHQDGPLVILYAISLAAAEQAIIAAGGRITAPTFEFPGGHRFHFNDGAGNQLGVWSE